VRHDPEPGDDRLYREGHAEGLGRHSHWRGLPDRERPTRGLASQVSPSASHRNDRGGNHWALLHPPSTSSPRRSVRSRLIAAGTSEGEGFRGSVRRVPARSCSDEVTHSGGTNGWAGAAPCCSKRWCIDLVGSTHEGPGRDRGSVCTVETLAWPLWPANDKYRLASDQPAVDDSGAVPSHPAPQEWASLLKREMKGLFGVRLPDRLGSGDCPLITRRPRHWGRRGGCYGCAGRGSY
jgi:hypothetical protein